VLARVLLAQGRPGPAFALLGRLLATAESQQRTGSVTGIRALQALALAASGHAAGAVEALAGALSLACPGGYVRLFAEELVITLDTVKKHVTHVLGKLGAANRTEAVARARQLGLIA